MADIAGGIGAGLGSLIGGLASKDTIAQGAAQQTQAMNEAIAALNQVGIPSIEAQQLVLQNPELVYQYSPTMQQAVSAGQSNMQNISTDPRLQQAQMSALEGLQQRAQGGMTPSDLANLANIQRGQGQQFASQNASIMQQAAEQGRSGSGSELAAKLAASQGAYQQGAQQSDALAGQNYQAKMQALQQAGQMGQSMQGQSFQQQAQQANAEDLMKQFNAQYQNQAQSANVNATNQANQYAAQMKQNMENQRASTANAQEQYNKGLYQTNFQNQMQRAGGIANMYNQQGNMYANQAKNKAANIQGTWSGAGEMAGAGAGMAMGGMGGGAAGAGTSGMGINENEYNGLMS